MAKLKSRKPETRDERVTFRCPPSLRTAIEAAALKDSRKMSDWIVLQLTRALAGEA
jgi:hypothetical protein